MGSTTIFYRQIPYRDVVLRAISLTAAGIGVLREDSSLPLFALPVALVVAAVTCSAALLTPDNHASPRIGVFACIATLVLIGPTTVFVPIPESHMLGGSALLVEALLTLSILRSHSAGAARREEHRARGMLLCWALATGFTLSNLLPGLVLMAFLPGDIRRRCIRWALPASLALCLLWFLGVMLKYDAWPPGIALARLSGGLSNELRFARSPTFGSLLFSAKSLIVAQFGLPHVRLVQAQDGGVPLTVLRPGFAWLTFQSAAFLLWCIGVGLLFISRRRLLRPVQRFCAASLISLLSVVLIHSVYGTPEAYLFAAHAWPFIALPTAALLTAPHPMPGSIRALLAASLLLSGIQLALALAGLLEQLRSI